MHVHLLKSHFQGVSQIYGVSKTGTAARPSWLRVQGNAAAVNISGGGKTANAGNRPMAMTSKTQAKKMDRMELVKGHFHSS